MRLRNLTMSIQSNSAIHLTTRGNKPSRCEVCLRPSRRVVSKNPRRVICKNCEEGQKTK